MRVIPVLDLKEGSVVRGMSGQRCNYHPIKSSLTVNARPSSVASVYAKVFGFDEAYVADLDAIAGDDPDAEIYRCIAVHLTRLWIDAGIACSSRARRMMRLDLTPALSVRLIVGLESVADEKDLADAFSVIGPEKAVFSLDLKNGRPLTDSPAWREEDPVQIAATALEIGFRRLIVLDLARVGASEGLSVEPICREVRRIAPKAELISGGGVRNRDDLCRLAEAGCDAALVASALHDGRLTSEDLATL